MNSKRIISNEKKARHFYHSNYKIFKISFEFTFHTEAKWKIQLTLLLQLKVNLEKELVKKAKVTKLCGRLGLT